MAASNCLCTIPQSISGVTVLSSNSNKSISSAQRHEGVRSESLALRREAYEREPDIRTSVVNYISRHDRQRARKRAFASSQST